MLSKLELEGDLRRLETEAAGGCQLSVQNLYALKEAANHWAKTSGNLSVLLRLALLFKRNGHLEAANEVLLLAYALKPEHRATVIHLSRIQEEMGRTKDALELISRLLKNFGADAATLSRAAILAEKTGDSDRSLRLRRQAAEVDPRMLSALIAKLATTSNVEETLSLIRAEINKGIEDAKLAFQCFSALKKLSDNSDEIAYARRLVLKNAAHEGRESLWSARVCRREGEFDLALSKISLAVLAAPLDPELRRERAVIALAIGAWGRDAKAILDALPFCSEFPDLRKEIRRADHLLRAFGGSLQDAAEDPARFAHVRTPESVFQYIAENTPAPNPNPSGGLVMVANSLAAGGAERIIAICAKHLSCEARVRGMKLYLFDLSPKRGGDFYLSDISGSDVVMLNADCPVSEPLSWLPSSVGKRVQSILDQLKRDRPRIVHTSLEPLNLYAGLAAVLAGTERILLHTHNMRPTALNPHDALAPKLRECYRALLGRPEVSLIGCADACVRDYCEWLTLHDAVKTYTIHNGLDFDQFEATRNLERVSQLRQSYQLSADGPVIGTAFRFEEVKRPFLWVDAAAIVHARKADCHFVMFGDGSLHARVREYVRSKHLTQQFVFPGLVSNLPRQLPLLDVFALSSRVEALPNVLLEAQAAGVPVVAYDVGGIAETMIDGVTGILVKEDSPDALAAAILRVIADPEWREVASGSAIDFVRNEFSTKKMINNLTEVLIGQDYAPVG